ncbi:hypothetical protein BGX28_001030 [Mortierella sp. GBA30]|nr:hypothetical protein BGX28_001030 [Mortierella sp. GBA30]
MSSMHGSAASTSAPMPLYSASSARKDKFWVQPGITYFVDWLTTRVNFDRISRKNPNSTEKIIDIYDEIAIHINAVTNHRTQWKRDTVKQKHQYAKRKYAEALDVKLQAGEGAIDETTRAKILEICPYFDRFHAVFGDSLASMHHHSEDGEPVALDSSDENDSGDDQGAMSETGGNINAVNVKDANGGSDGYTITKEQEERWNDIRRRERLLEARESSWHHKALDLEGQHQEMLNRRVKQFDEMLYRRHQEFDAMLDRRWREFHRERAEFMDERAAFKSVRDKLLIENATLRAQLSATRS